MVSVKPAPSKQRGLITPLSVYQCSVSVKPAPSKQRGGLKVGRRHRFETDPHELYRLASIGTENFEDIYKYIVAA
jgi:hypothetical protein